MATTDPTPAATLLADLESRQDELLRLLSDLEERTKAALAQLGVHTASPVTSAPQQRVGQPTVDRKAA